MTILFSRCSEKETSINTPLFEKLPSSRTGIYFNNINEETDQHNILTYEYFYNGGGVAVGDINNDGLLDIYFSANQGENKLYLNQGNFKFKDITQSAGIHAKSGWRTGVAMVDINGDGYLDIYVCRSGNNHPLLRENSFFINNQDLTFSDKAKTLGLNDNSYSTQAAFLDFDRDGDLDVFLLNHSRLAISNSYDISNRYLKDRVKYVGNRFLRNDNGQFVDISDSVGILGHAANYGLGIAISDLNEDGWPDIYITNDYTSSDELLINDGGKSFKNASDSLLTHMSQFSMGVEIADVNNDGLSDIISLDMLPEENKKQKSFFWPDQYDVYKAMVDNGLHHQYMRNMLHLNNGEGAFSEIGQLSGISNTDWSWAPLLADFDNDGLQDLFITNGFKRNFTDNDFLNFKSNLVMQAKEGKGPKKLTEVLELIPANLVHNYCFKNKNGILFEDKSTSWGFEAPTLSNGAAYADFDNDGDLDLVVNNLAQEASIFENKSNTNHNFLKIQLTASGHNTFALGATVKVFADGQTLKRTNNPYRGFQSSVPPLLHFGLGSVSSIDSLTVHWPDGKIENHYDLEVNQLLQIVQKDALSEINRPVYQINATPMIKEVRNAINFTHRENDFIDFNVQSMLPSMYSTLGPALAIGKSKERDRNLLYVGGAKEQAGRLLIREGDHYRQIIDLQDNVSSEEIDATFFDADNDGDDDLYIVNGGYEFKNNDNLLQDKLYINNGNGKFSPKSLPTFLTSGSCVREADIDNDGDLDLFVGGRITPGRYPEDPSHYLLINDGNGNFKLKSDAGSSVLKTLGMITDAVWIDLNKDGWQDLIIVGEWMPITVLINNNGSFENKSEMYFDQNTSGWWNRILAEDFDHDGNKDLIIGNYGMNNQFKPSPKKPISLYFDDYDNNGSIDPLMNYYIGDTSYPLPTKDELSRQSPIFKKRFTDYKSYASATINEVLTDEEIQKSQKLEAYKLTTSYFKNEGGKFKEMTLPIEMQIAPIYALGALDVNGDGHLDIVAAGNHSKVRARFGRAVGNFGTLLMGDGNGNFSYLPPKSNKLKITGDVRQLIVGNGHIIFAINNAMPKVYKLLPSNKQIQTQ